MPEDRDALKHKKTSLRFWALPPYEAPCALALPDGRLALNVRGLPFFLFGTIAYGGILWRAARSKSQPWDLGLFVIVFLAFVFALHFWSNRTAHRHIDLRWYDFLFFSSFVTLTVLLHSVDLTHWSFGFIGDELAFFQHAKHIACGQPWNPFDLSGVYNVHPILDSAYQAVFMRVFGINILGWRFAEVWIAGVSVGLVYLLGMILCGRFVAVSSAVVLASSHYLMAFSRIGYNNTHCIPFGLMAFLLAALALRSGRVTLLFLTGTAIGLCAYTFMAAYLTGPIVVVFLLTLLRRKSLPAQILSFLWLTAGIFLALGPAVLTNSMTDMAEEIAFQTRREIAGEKPWFVLGSSLRHSVESFWINRCWFHHYIGGPLLDRISGLLVILGLGFSTIHFRRTAFRVGILWFIVGLVAIAATNYRPEPPTTRLLYLLPSLSLLAGVGALGIRTAFVRCFRHSSNWITIPAASLLVAAILFLNLRQLFRENPSRTHPNDVIITLKILQQNPAKRLVDVTDGPSNFNVQSIIDLYPAYLERYHFTDVQEFKTYAADKIQVNDTLYLARTPSVACQVARRLGDSFDTLVDENSAGTFRIWLFVPRVVATHTETVSY